MNVIRELFSKFNPTGSQWIYLKHSRYYIITRISTAHVSLPSHYWHNSRKKDCSSSSVKLITIFLQSEATIKIALVLLYEVHLRLYTVYGFLRAKRESKMHITNPQDTS